MATKAKATAKKSTKKADKAAKGSAADKASAKQGNQMYRAAKPYRAAKTVPVSLLPPDFSRADLDF